jgi:hypothetical protein
MSAGEIRVNDVGTVFELTVTDASGAVDISGATTKQISLEPPTRANKVTKAATFTTDGTDGKMLYTTVAGDLDEAGSWRVQGYVVLDANNEFRTDIHTVTVHENI